MILKGKHAHPQGSCWYSFPRNKRLRCVLLSFFCSSDFASLFSLFHLVCCGQEAISAKKYEKKQNKTWCILTNAAVALSALHTVGQVRRSTYWTNQQTAVAVTHHCKMTKVSIQGMHCTWRASVRLKARPRIPVHTEHIFPPLQVCQK